MKVEYIPERDWIEIQFPDHTRVLNIDEARNIRDQLDAAIDDYEQATAPPPVISDPNSEVVTARVVKDTGGDS